MKLESGGEEEQTTFEKKKTKTALVPPCTEEGSIIGRKGVDEQV